MTDQIIEHPKNLICNFRAPTLEEYLEHKEFCREVKEDGLDVCRVLLSFEKGYRLARKGSKEAIQLYSTQQVVNIQQNNQFLYAVPKPRREPYDLSCVREEYQRTFSSVLFEAYVLHKARGLGMEFSYRDFLELKHSAFRRIALRLKRKGLIMANPLRTVPRFYYLAETLEGKNSNENNTVKQLFTN